MEDPTGLSDSTRHLVRTADALSDDELAGPSGLPGWTRAHVLAHLALNAEGLSGALVGVTQGARVPMYRSQEARDTDIDELAAAGPTEVRDRLLGGTARLADALAAVPQDRSEVSIERLPGGRSFTVADVPWMRWIEVEVHHADLDAGYAHTSWPLTLCAEVLDAALTRSLPSGPLTAYAVDLDRRWVYGEGGPTVSGRAADLAWWLSGRGTGDGVTSERGELPQIGAW